MLAALLCYFIYYDAELLLLSCFIAMLAELALLAELPWCFIALLGIFALFAVFLCC